MREELLRMERVICKNGDQTILDRFNLNIFKGEVVLVLGIHDAGHQVLVELLSGMRKPESGRILLEENTIHLHHMDEARALGIYSVLQDTRLVPDLTVAENIFVIRPSRHHRGVIFRRAMEHQTKQILDSVGMDLTPDTPARYLSVADQHLIEIAKDVTMGAKLIVNDDLRLPYTHRELERLHRMVRQYVQRGVSFLIVSSHNDEMDNVFSIADRIVVIRDGQNVRELHEREAVPAEITNLMVGREFHASALPAKSIPAEAVLRVSDVCTKSLRNVSFAVQAGEIVGLLDLARYANQDVKDILIGGERDYTGSVSLNGEAVRFSCLGEAIKAGVGYIPALPISGQLMNGMTAAENLSLILMRRKKRPPQIKLRKRSFILLKDNLEELGLPNHTKDCSVDELPMTVRLRLLYLRWILGKCRLLVCVKPYISLDVVLRDVAQSMLVRAAQNGMGVVVVSSDPSEVASICDRIVIFSSGQVKSILTRNEFVETDLSRYS